MAVVYVVVCPTCYTPNVTDEPGTEQEKEQDGASIQCTQCGNTVSAHGGQVRIFKKAAKRVEADLFGFNDM